MDNKNLVSIPISGDQGRDVTEEKRASPVDGVLVRGAPPVDCVLVRGASPVDGVLVRGALTCRWCTR